jgi:two-component system phosphate regulon sensor histidine kinase PhoR
MQTLVQDLLTLSRLEGSPPPGFSEWIEAEELCSLCVDEGRALSVLLWPEPAAPQQVRLHAVPAISLAGSPSELRSALSNLVSNAVRYTQQEDRSTSRPDSVRRPCRIAVTDTGPGIAPGFAAPERRFTGSTAAARAESGGTDSGWPLRSMSRNDTTAS